MKDIYRYHQGKLELEKRPVVEEYPLVLHVNGREIATLIASPHDLRFLVAGFLRLQGFVDRVEDFHMLAVCDDYGVANVKLARDLPDRLKPILTSGCGTGITFSLPETATSRGAATRESPPVRPEAVFRLMSELSRMTESYRSHGGIHSAAVGGVDGALILFAEDIGRHNTLDRIAGEALLKGIDLEGKLLVTSGRVSSEMAAKAAHLGITLLASRTSPTDKAMEICEAAGIALIGYVRGDHFYIYTNPGKLVMEELPEHRDDMEFTPSPAAPISFPDRIPGVAGIILAGGSSSRMGSNKALLPLHGTPLIQFIYDQMSTIFAEIIVVTDTPDTYSFLPCRKVSDIYHKMGALGGIHSGLANMVNDRAFVTACDMPFINVDLVRALAVRADGCDAVIPCTTDGFQPLHCVYNRSCAVLFENCLREGTTKMMSILDKIDARLMSPGEVCRLDPGYRSFCNVNTPQQYQELQVIPVTENHQRQKGPQAFDRVVEKKPKKQ